MLHYMGPHVWMTRRRTVKHPFSPLFFKDPTDTIGLTATAKPTAIDAGAGTHRHHRQLR